MSLPFIVNLGDFGGSSRPVSAGVMLLACNEQFGETLIKIIGAIFVFILIAASPAFSQWKQNDKPAVDAPDRKEVKGFGGHLIVVKDPQRFIQEWLKPETPRINAASVVERGEVLGAFVLFAGCKPGDSRGM